MDGVLGLTAKGFLDSIRQITVWHVLVGWIEEVKSDSGALKDKVAALEDERDIYMP